MSSEDKVSNKAEELKGRAKEWAGDKTHDRDLEAEGSADQSSAKAKQAGEHLKDAVRNAKDAVTGRGE